jgi:D-arabinose 1-dehydrogenase-like Zn-dependent alcohol dehydrogenase
LKRYISEDQNHSKKVGIIGYGGLGQLGVQIAKKIYNCEVYVITSAGENSKKFKKLSKLKDEKLIEEIILSEEL